MKPEPRDVLVEIERTQGLPPQRVTGVVARQMLRPLGTHPTAAEQDSVLHWLRATPQGQSVALQLAAKRPGHARRKGYSLASVTLPAFAQELARELDIPRPLDDSVEVLEAFEAWLARVLPPATAKDRKPTVNAASGSGQSIAPASVYAQQPVAPGTAAQSPGAATSKATICILVLAPQAAHPALLMGLLRHLASVSRAKSAPTSNQALVKLALGAARTGTLSAAVARALLAGHDSIRTLRDRAEAEARGAQVAAASLSSQLDAKTVELVALQVQLRGAAAHADAQDQAMAVLRERVAAAEASLNAAHDSAQKAEAFWRTELPKRISQATSRMASTLDADLAEAVLALEGGAPNVPMALRRLARIRESIHGEESA